MVNLPVNSRIHRNAALVTRFKKSLFLQSAKTFSILCSYVVVYCNEVWKQKISVIIFQRKNLLIICMKWLLTWTPTYFNMS